jgi:hypothetical protein
MSVRASEPAAKVSEALAKAQAQCKPVAKSGFNKYDNYAYSMHEDYVTASRDALSSNELSIVYSIKEYKHLEQRITKNGGKENVIEVILTARALHSSGEWLEVDYTGEGQDRSDKAGYKATTGAKKYALAGLLNLATTDDPENDELDDDKKPAFTPQNKFKPKQPIPAQNNKQAVSEITPNEREKIRSNFVDQINAAENMQTLKSAYEKAAEQAKAWEDRLSFDLFVQVKNTKKKELESKTKQTTV